LWIYFVLSTPLTLTVFGLWFLFDRTARRKHALGAEDDQNEAKIASEREARIMRRISMRTGIKVADTFPISGTTSGPA
jgi:hypothetical protein